MHHLYLTCFSPTTVIYSKARRVDASKIVKLLSVFEKGSSQRINNEKSSIFFCQNTAQDTKQEISSILRFREANEHTTYLGLSNIINRNKTDVRLFERSYVWENPRVNNITISKGRKEILLKTVVLDLPKYAMSMFLLPKKVIHRGKKYNV